MNRALTHVFEFMHGDTGNMFRSLLSGYLVTEPPAGAGLSDRGAETAVLTPPCVSDRIAAQVTTGVQDAGS